MKKESFGVVNSNTHLLVISLTKIINGANIKKSIDSLTKPDGNIAFPMKYVEINSFHCSVPRTQVNSVTETTLEMIFTILQMKNKELKKKKQTFPGLHSHLMETVGYKVRHLNLKSALLATCHPLFTLHPINS